MLESVDWHGLGLLACRSCGGIWVRTADLPVALGDRRADLDELNAIYPGTGSLSSFANLSAPCPECHVDLVIQPLALAPEQSSMTCPSCGGAWLDPATRSNLGAAHTVTPTAEVTVQLPPVEVTPPLLPPYIGVRRWCPQCRRDFPESFTFCTECNIGLAEATFEVPCLSCGLRGPIGRETCATCGANMRTGAPAAVGQSDRSDASDLSDRSDQNDPILAANAAYARDFRYGHMAREPRKRIAVLTCMDARMRLYEMLGMEAGDLNVIRNAGGIVTEDSLRSLILSHHLLGTQEFYVIAHTDCGLLAITDEEFRARLVRETGASSAIPATFHAFTNLEENVREQLRRLRSHPWIPQSIRIRGFIYNVRNGRLTEILLGG